MVLAELAFSAIILLAIGIPILLAFIKMIYQYESGIVFTLGKFTGARGPGINIIIPIFQELRKVDMRIKTVDIPKQEVMTKDNVPVAVNAVVYFRVASPEKAILKIQDYLYAVAQYGQTALRDVIGNQELDSVLTEREKLATLMKEIVDKETEEWGVDITAIKLQDIELPADMKRAMARQAEAEREKRATIIMSEGEFAASSNLSKAAAVLSSTPGALHLRTLQTISDVSTEEGNTVLFVTPIEVLKSLERLGGGVGASILKKSEK
ncbi:Stomatin [Candidatus Gugararchaeum adminiculabundum]|nr:Stomatin [Candidatus Gugararchaeum adminiculabundum]